MNRFVYIIFLALIFVSILSFGQPGDPGGDPDVPITGIEILLSAGALLGLKKMLGKSKQK